MEVVKFFSFKTEGIYYRPLSVQLVTFLARGIFGLRPAWFHLIGLILHLLAVAVVYKLIKKTGLSMPALDYFLWSEGQKVQGLYHHLTKTTAY